MARAVKPGRKVKLTLGPSTRTQRRKEAAEARKLIWVKGCAKCGEDHEYLRCSAEPGATLGADN